jgi:hypothetical protein
MKDDNVIRIQALSRIRVQSEDPRSLPLSSIATCLGRKLIFMKLYDALTILTCISFVYLTKLEIFVAIT